MPLTAAVVAGIVVTAMLPVGFALASGALVGSVRAAAAQGFDSAPGRRLLVAVGAVAVLFVLQQVSGPVVRELADALGRRLNGRLRLRVMAATLQPTGIAHLEDPAVLDKVAAAQSVGTGQITPQEAIVGVASVGAVRVGALASAAVLVAFRWWLAAGLVLVHGGVTLFLTSNLERMVRALRGHARRFRRSSYFRDLALTPAAAKEVRLFGLADWVGDRFARHWEAAMAGFWSERRRAWWRGPACSLAVLGAQAWAYAVLGVAAARGRISLGELTTFAVAVAGVAAIRNIGGDNINISYGTAAVPAVLELEEATAGPAFLLGGERPADALPATAIRFERVSFQYPGRQDHVFQDLDLEIPAGRSLAIVGDNGAGKTTLVKLLLRLYDPTAGRIVVDGIDLRQLDPLAWRRRAAAIFQDFVHYQLSVTDNVGFGAPGHLGDRTAMVGAADRAGVTGIVDGLAQGWDTVLSREYRGGAELSGGEWQRLALARALFAVTAGGAGVLVLDEPTAALDVRAEAAFYDRFFDLTAGLTTVIISHRFSTVRRADRIVVIEHGRVTEGGDHDSLVAAGGRYATMFALQAARFVDEVDGPDTRPSGNGPCRA
jgi:ABC-type multidrug transport system fused ATPase/permease subunit